MTAPATLRSSEPAQRPPVLTQGLGGAVICGVLALLSQAGHWPLAAGVLLLQLLLVLGFLALVDAPASGGAFLVAALATLAADGVVLAADGRVSGLAGVVGLAFVGALLHQLVRRKRTRVTESLADTLVAVVLAVAVVPVVALRMSGGGEEAVRVCLVAGAAALLAGRIGDRVLPRPALALGATRGWPGLLLGLGAGAAAAVAVAGDTGAVAGTRGALLGLAVAASAAAADLAVDLGAAELTAGRRDARRVSALRPVGLVLPVAALAPVAFVAGRLVLS
ncbi:MAG: conserved rane protein of unknown function [Frankiales bacterium]|jgi:hypothetical protein|nr:conserved rane protein of unknown function [Frankiales bacterium]